MGRDQGMGNEQEQSTGAQERALAVAPVRLRDPGGGRRSAMTAAVVVAAALAVAIVLASLPGQAPPPSVGPSAASPATPSSFGTSAPASTTGASAAPTPLMGFDPIGIPQLLAMTPATDHFRLAKQIRDGELDGHVVIVRGKLETIRVRCPAHGTCIMAAIQGLDLRVTVDERSLPWREIPGGPAWLALSVRRDQLVFMGTAGDQLSTLKIADGWLALATWCEDAYGADPACPLTGPMLHPVPEGPSWRGGEDGGEQVRVQPDELVGAPRNQAWFTGPFLLLDPLPPCERMPAIGPEEAPGGGMTLAMALAASATPASTDPPCDTDQRRTVMARIVPGAIPWTVIPDPDTSSQP